MAIRLIDTYPGKVGAPDADYPEGVPRNVTAPGALDGTPWEEALLRDMQGLMQGLLAQVPAGPVVPSGTPDTVLASQYIDSMKLIVQGLDILGFESAELDTALRLAPDGLGNTQWLLNVVEQLATATLDTSLVLSPDGLGGVVFGGIPVNGGLQSTQIFTSDDTWTKPAGIRFIKVTVVSGGGGGGGADNDASDSSGGGGGSGGGGVIAWLDATALTSETITIGAGGAGSPFPPSHANGTDGAKSSFGTLIRAFGGDGGRVGNQGLGGDGGTPQGGDIEPAGSFEFKSQGGGPGLGLIGGGAAIGGAGGGSLGGGGQKGNANTGSGSNVSGFSGGGAGASQIGGSSAAGGSGGDGVVIVEEYA